MAQLQTSDDLSSPSNIEDFSSPSSSGDEPNFLVPTSPTSDDQLSGSPAFSSSVAYDLNTSRTSSEPLSPVEPLATNQPFSASDPCEASKTSRCTSDGVVEEAQSHTSFLDSYPVSTLIKNVKDSFVAEAACSYVKDINSRSSSFVRTIFDNQLLRFIRKVSPTVSSVFSRLVDQPDQPERCSDDGAMVPESNEILNDLFNRKHQITSAVQTTITNSKSAVANIIGEFRSRRDSFIIELLRRKDLLLDDISTQPNFIKLKAGAESTLQTVDNFKTVTHRHFDASRNQFYSYKDQTVSAIQEFRGTNDRVVFLKKVASQQFEYLAIIFSSDRVGPWIAVIWPSATVALLRQLSSIVVQTYSALQHGWRTVQEGSVCNAAVAANDLLFRIVQGNSQKVSNFFSKFSSLLCSSMDGSIVSSAFVYVYETTNISYWVKNATPSATERS